MKLKMLSIAAVALTMASGAALAQTSGSSGSDAAPSVFEDPATMQPFFSDSSMSTMKTDEEVKAAFNGLPAEQQENMKSQCMDTTSGKYMDFCAKINAL